VSEQKLLGLMHANDGMTQLAFESSHLIPHSLTITYQKQMSGADAETFIMSFCDKVCRIADMDIYTKPQNADGTCLSEIKITLEPDRGIMKVMDPSVYYMVQLLRRMLDQDDLGKDISEKVASEVRAIFKRS